jgi:hypothetical protein
MYRDWSAGDATNVELANATGVAEWATAAAAKFFQDCPASTPGASSVRFLPIRDEPFWSWQAAPVGSSAVVRARWRGFLEAQGMTPALIGATGWDGVTPIGRGAARAATAGGGIARALAVRRRYYWSVRYAAFEATQFFANGTALKISLCPSRDSQP